MADDGTNCSICRKPLLDGEAIYSLTLDHYDCKFPNGQEKQESLASIFARGDEALRKMGLRTKRPEGEGKTAKKAVALAVAAIQQEVGAQLTETTLWNQQGAYRGKAWDLDRWGLDFQFVRDGHVINGCASSLATMTDCARSGRLQAVPGDLAWSFNLYPAAQQPNTTATQSDHR